MTDCVPTHFNGRKVLLWQCLYISQCSIEHTYTCIIYAYTHTYNHTHTFIHAYNHTYSHRHVPPGTSISQAQLPTQTGIHLADASSQTETCPASQSTNLAMEVGPDTCEDTRQIMIIRDWAWARPTLRVGQRGVVHKTKCYPLMLEISTWEEYTRLLTF